MHTKPERRFGPYHRKGEPYMIDREVDDDKMPFISDENIREIIWFCRILPLAVIAIEGSCLIINAHSGGFDYWPLHGFHHF